MSVNLQDVDGLRDLGVFIVIQLFIVHAVVTGCEDLQYCSATYRLVKAKGRQSGGTDRDNGNGGQPNAKEELVQMTYKGWLILPL